jgi:multidrug resistance efflux pump
MRDVLVRGLADCTEFRQTLLARPPRVVHGTAVLLTALLAVAVTWAALTEADLVVRVPGRVRPVTTPVKVVAGANAETLSATSGGRVVAVHCREGDPVKQGQVLIELDTQQLDSEIARRRRMLSASEEELANLARQEALLAQQAEAARKKAEAQLAQAEERVRQARERRTCDVRLAELELDGAVSDLESMRKLAPTRAIARVELIKAQVKVGEARQKLARARLPVDESDVGVLRRGLELVAGDQALRRKELETKRDSRRGEVDAARIELAKLRREREQSILRAPVAGVVTSGDVKVGDILERGKPAVEIAEQRGFRFEAAVPSEEVGDLRVGLPARVKLDAYDYQRYGTAPGAVCHIAPDSGVAAGRGATYLVKVELQADEVGRGELRGQVKLGMAGQVEIQTGRESLLRLLWKKIRHTISLG